MNTTPLGSTPTFYSSYNNKDLKNLGNNLDSSKERIEFEKWLLNNFTPKQATAADFAWHSNVISLLCEKGRRDLNHTSEEESTEDRLIAKLISKADSEKQDIGKVIASFWGATERKLNFSQIYSSLQADLPFTCTVLLRKLLETTPLKEIFKQAIADKNFAMLKAIAIKNPEQFEALLLEKNSQGQTQLYLAINHQDIELVELFSKLAPFAVKKSITIQSNDQVTPVERAVYNNDIEILKFLSEIAPEEVKKALAIQDKHGWTPLHWAVYLKNIKVTELLVDWAPEAALIVNQDGETALSILKGNRPLGYQAISDLFKDIPEAWNYQKTHTARKALAHEWHLSGVSSFIKKEGEKPKWEWLVIGLLNGFIC